MPTTNERGFLFSLDLLCSFTAICLISLISMQVLNNAVKANARQLQSFELEKNAVMLLDAMVKNRNEENPALGAAVFNEEKRRVEENNIDVDFLKGADPIVSKKVFLKRLELVFKDGARETVLEFDWGKNCLGVNRLVMARNKKALLQGVVCVE